MCTEKKLIYNNVYRPVNNNASIVIEQNCNSITIINIGATQALVDTVIPLNAGVPGTNNGESISFGGNRLEIFSGRLDISFPAGAGGNVVVIQKIYLPGQF
jgi:hypothetical protein